MKKKEKYNQYDEWYQNRRFDYVKSLKALEEEFHRLEGAHKLYEITESEEWKQHKREAYVAYKMTYNFTANLYNEITRYWYEHQEEMDKCKTWNVTLWHPDEWLIRWAGGLK